MNGFIFGDMRPSSLFDFRAIDTKTIRFGCVPSGNRAFSLLYRFLMTWWGRSLRSNLSCYCTDKQILRQTFIFYWTHSKHPYFQKHKIYHKIIYSFFPDKLPVQSTITVLIWNGVFFCLFERFWNLSQSTNGYLRVKNNG